MRKCTAALVADLVDVDRRELDDGRVALRARRAKAHTFRCRQRMQRRDVSGYLGADRWAARLSLGTAT